MTNNAEARAREVLGQCCPGMGWSEGEKQTIATAMLAYGNERAAQEREANAALCRDVEIEQANNNGAANTGGAAECWHRIVTRGQQ